MEFTNSEKEFTFLNALNPLVDLLESQDMSVSIVINERFNVKSVDLKGEGNSNASMGVSFLLSYLPTDFYQKKFDFISITLSKVDELSIDFGKFLKESYPSLSLSDDNTILINKFPDKSFDVRVRSCINFICSVLKSPQIAAYLKGENWTDEYYMAWFEGTGF